MTDASARGISTPVLLGRYRISERLGSGRLAVVYAAVDERLQRQVLVHLLRKDLADQPRLADRFRAEISASAQRSHAALLEVFDSGEITARPFVVTEYVTGRPLRTLGAVALEPALLYVRQVANAVALCQTSAILHPPISSANVLLVEEGRVKLVENWLLPPDAAGLDLAHYRAPERSAGGPPGPAAAVYALGLLLYELISGARPVQGSDARAVAASHLAFQLPPLQQSRPGLYAPGLEQLLVSATARDPQARFADAAAFSAALDAFWRNSSAATRPLAVAPARTGRRAQPPRDPPTPVLAPPVAGTPPPATIAPAPDPPALETLPLQPDAATAGQLPPLSRSAARRRSRRHGLTGWLVMLGLVLLVAFGSYLGATILVERVAGLQLPRPGLDGVGISLPGWLTGSDQQNVLIVNIVEGLNLRDAPGLDSNVLVTIPNGAPVQKLAGPTNVDNIPWLRVRAEFDGRVIEGWMSENYLKPPD